MKVGRKVLLVSGLVLLVPIVAWGANPTINSTDTKVMASDFFSNGTDYPGWGPEGNGTYYYPTGFIAQDPHTGQDALFIFVQGGQTDSANLFIDEPSSQYANCGEDEAILLVIPANSIGTRTDLIGSVFKPENTIRVSECGDYWGPGSTFENHRNGDRYLLLNSNHGPIQMVESPSSLGYDQYRKWINRQDLIVDVAPGADTPVHFDIAPSQTSEAWIGSTLKYRDWEGFTRFEDHDTFGTGALDVGRAKIRYSPYLYGSTNPWRVFIVDTDDTWHMVNPTTKVVDFEIKRYEGGLAAADIFRNEFGWYEAWFVDYTQGRGDVPPGCSVGDPNYRRGFTGETLSYFRWWANATPSSSGRASTKISLQDGSPPWSSYRPAHLDYATGREGSMRINYSGHRYLFSAHNDTNICDSAVGTENPYQGLYVTVEELSYYDAH